MGEIKIKTWTEIFHEELDAVRKRVQAVCEENVALSDENIKYKIKIEDMKAVLEKLVDWHYEALDHHVISYGPSLIVVDKIVREAKELIKR